MKIGFDAKRAFCNHRGLGNYSRETIRIMSTQIPGNQYFLFTPDICPDIRFELTGNTEVVIPSFSPGNLTKAFWRTYLIPEKAKLKGVELYHGLSHELPIGIEKTKIHTVVTMHDLLFIKQPELFSKFDREMYSKKYLRSCKVADRIIAVSEHTKRDLLALTDTPEEKVEVVYQGCRPDFKMLVGETKKKMIKERYHLPSNYLLNVGAFEPRKNQMLILKAFRLNSPSGANNHPETDEGHNKE